MFLKLPQKLFDDLVKVANAEGKSASFYIVETVKSHLDKLAEEKKSN